MRPMRGILVALGCLLASGVAAGGEVGNPIEVAPKVEGTQMQMWPRAAWAAESKSWLVVWREGYINEEATDVWAARVSGDGKALDPAGIKVCVAKDRQEKAVVTSDGKGWLVVWEDFRNGKDYDVYAARVSAEGKVLDPEGTLVAGGGHNQCYPAVAFAGGNYVVVWMAFVGETPDGTKMKDGTTSAYKIFGTTVSPEGKVATPGGALMTPEAGIWHALRPAAVAAGDGQHVLVAFKAVVGKPQSTGIGTFMVDGTSGKAESRFKDPGGGGNREQDKGRPGDALAGMPLSVAWGKEGGLVFSVGREVLDEISAWRLDASGTRITPKLAGARGHQPGFQPMYSVASDGEQYLVTRDRVVSQKPLPVLGVQARLVPADWKGGDSPKAKEGALDQDFFLVAGDGKKSCLMGQAASGPKGTFLVAYSEARGIDDVKVVARTVGAK